MPKLSNRPPRYSHHRASGRALVRLDGQVHYLGSYGTRASKEAYDRLIAEWYAGGRSLKRVGSNLPALTVSELVAKYKDFATGYYRHVDGIRLACRYLRQLYGGTEAQAFGPLGLQAVMRRMVDDDLARTTICDHLARIRRMFRWAVAQQLVPVTTLQALECVTGPRKGRGEAREPKPVQPVADAVVEATLPHLPPIVRAMVELHRIIGARPSELCGIRPCDIDRGGDVWWFRPAEHKTAHHGKSRDIPIGPRGQAILLPYLDRPADAYCFDPTEAVKAHREARAAKRTTPQSCGNVRGTNRKRRPKVKPGRCYTKDSYRRAVANACEVAFAMPAELREPAKAYRDLLAAWNKAKTPKSQRKAPADLAAAEAERQRQASEWRDANTWSPSQLRHSVATSVRKQFGLEAAQVMLGHSRADVTQVYAERNLALAADVARKIG